MERALRANTLHAHRLLWLAEATGHQYALKERLLKAYFVDGLDVGDPDVLATCAGEVGMPADNVRAFLDSDDGVAEVREQLAFAAEAEISAVPTFVIDGRWAIPGAQDADTFVNVIHRLLERRNA
jgi:predicted DsbA family dithiol-disulfide isomerase